MSSITRIMGTRVILDLSRGQLGPIIRFHNCSIYDGQIPQIDEADQELSVFQLIAQNTFPHGAEQWEYQGESRSRADVGLRLAVV